LSKIEANGTRQLFDVPNSATPSRVILRTGGFFEVFASLFLLESGHQRRDAGIVEQRFGRGQPAGIEEASG